MKSSAKVWVAALAAALIALAFSCSSTAKPAEKKAEAPKDAAPSAPPNVTVDAVFGTPTVLDGSMDSVFEKATVIDTPFKTFGDLPDTATGKARLAWDDKYLWAYIEVTDKVINATNPNAWEQDSIEVFIDELNKKPKSYGVGVAQYRVNVKGVVSASNGASVGKFKSFVKMTDYGYSALIGIPFTRITPAAGAYVGFEFQINDDNGKKSRTGIRTWANGTNNDWQDASGFGNAHLVK